ncbi:hypothetical protein FA15DRAFT_676642 [Coprinopsis marcescibilis]|uniref:Uncharacterized protein n=1 Tax=Coprinopsis marcescibilis TaxID=230819 RepID=A0A5C3K9Q9_COPMA|nr:hypothetical protein FA15DRAFT_676642 [Coprinopsis marcescibilis]
MKLIGPLTITPQVQHKPFTNTVRDALSFGLTSLHDAGSTPSPWISSLDNPNEKAASDYNLTEVIQQVPLYCFHHRRSFL